MSSLHSLLLISAPAGEPSVPNSQQDCTLEFIIGVLADQHKTDLAERKKRHEFLVETVTVSAALPCTMMPVVG